MYPSRKRAAEIARNTIEIVVAGRYTNSRGEKVVLQPLIETAMNGTVSYPPNATLPAIGTRDLSSAKPGFTAAPADTRDLSPAKPGFTAAPSVPANRQTVFEVINDTTLEAARKLTAEGYQPVALNFASARHPGGGFLNGARAQEESLCRSSALYECINGNAMYRHHATLSGGFYANYAIYSPTVPVFKNDDGEHLDEPYLCAFVTSPAVNAGVHVKERKHHDEVRTEMRDRIEKVLTIMAGHGHDAAVLGAWGCGVFKNDPEVIAELFAQALRGSFAGVFAKVVFAVLSTDGETIRPFEERFSS